MGFHGGPGPGGKRGRVVSRRTGAAKAVDLLLYVCARPVLFVLGRLPLPWVVRMGRWAGLAAFVVDGRHRRVALENLRIAFPHLRASERWAIARKSFENVGMTMMELPALARMSPEVIRRRVRYVGLEPYEAALRENPAALLLTGHFGNWELMALAFGAERGRLAFVARPLDNPFFDRWLRRLRTRTGNRMIEKKGALRGVRRALSEGYLVGLLMDQRVTGREGVFVDFFGHPAGSSAALALLAGRFQVPVHPVYTVRGPTDLEHTIYIGPEIRMAQTGRRRVDIVENTQRIQKALEEIVRRHPDQWFWMHRRWRKSPTAGYGWRRKDR